MSTPAPKFFTPEIEFRWTEYIVFALVLVASLGIGVFYGFFGGKNKTNEEFLMAGRSMSILPVTLSLVCSFVSAITLLGNPQEAYFYGYMHTFMAFSFLPMTLLLAYIYVPVFFGLQLTSAYEYFEWRFSRRLRLTVTVCAIVHLFFYMPTTVYGPSLALDEVAGIDTTISTAAIFIVCILYSSLGGLKAVLWTDALQAAVMVISLGAVIFAGMAHVGGASFIWEKASSTDRTTVIFDTDLRQRHTFWTAMIGGLFMWLPLFAGTQAQIQRYNSVATLSKARLCLIFNMCGLLLIMGLCGWIGFMMYGKYYDCDPVTAKFIKSSDQLLPFFVMEVLNDYPGIPGLLVAGLTCGSLSSVSSALNSATALITEDFVKAYKPDLSEERLGLISKIISTVSGIIAFSLVFIIAEANKTIQIAPFTTVLHGSLLGPILSAFSLGMFFPWTEEKGTLMAVIISVILSSAQGVGNIFEGRAGKLPNMRLTLSTDGCEIVGNETLRFLDALTERSPVLLTGIDDWKADHADDSFLLKILGISYVWQSVIGALSTFILGMIFSGIIVLLRKEAGPKVNESLLSKPFTKLWGKLLGKSYLEKWIDSHSPPYSGNPAEKENRIKTMEIMKAEKQ